MISVIAFDFFGVLCPPMYGGVLKELFGDSEEARLRWMRMVEIELDRGDITEEEFIFRLGEATGMNPLEIKRRSYEYGVLNKQLISLIREIKKNYRIGLLTNAPRSIITNVLKDDFPLFDIPVISADIHLIKPDREIFEYFISESGTSADEIFFTDDNPKNITAAQSCGMKGAVFTDVATLQAQLAQSGIVF